MKTYRGTREHNGVAKVTVEESGLKPRALPPCLNLRNHSPSGEVEWGYGGSGPAQLALALLADHLADAPASAGDVLAQAVYQDFKFAVVARLPRPGWTLTTAQVGEALCRLASEDENHFWRRIVGALDAALFTAVIEEHGRDPEPAELQRRAVEIITGVFPVSVDYARRQVVIYYLHEELREEVAR